MQNRAQLLHPPWSGMGQVSALKPTAGSGICLHLRSASEQKEKGAEVLRVQKDLVLCHGAGWEPGAAGASLAREVLLQQLGAGLSCQASLGLCHLGNKFSLAASLQAGFGFLASWGAEPQPHGLAERVPGRPREQLGAGSGAEPRCTAAPVPVGGWWGRGGERAARSSRCQIFPSVPPATAWQILARICDGSCQHCRAMPGSADVACSLDRRSSHVALVSLPQIRSLCSSEEAEPSSELP